MGRVYWSGSAQADSGEPDGDRRRVLRASHDGVLIADAQIGDHLEEGQLIAEIQPEDGSDNYLDLQSIQRSAARIDPPWHSSNQRHEDR